MNKNKASARIISKWQIVWATVVAICICALLAFATVFTNKQTAKMRTTMNDATYDNMSNLLNTVGNLVSATFVTDQQYAESLASTLAAAVDTRQWLDDLEFDKSRTIGIYFAETGADTAVGKNGSTLSLAGHTFTEHRDGQVRSGAYMTEYGSYAYIQREPVQKDGEQIGYLYVIFPLARYGHLFPEQITQSNDISLLESDTMRYIYIPSDSASGIHVSYNTLKYYLKDPDLAPKILDEIKDAIQNRQYYMRLVTFTRSKNDGMEDADYVMFLWPVDDGEYYISGFSRVQFLQGERISVENTVGTMLWLLTGASALIVVLLLAMMLSMFLLFRKSTATQEKHAEELNNALEIANVANESKSNFLSNMSHDIRTPMNAIVGFTTLIANDADNPDKVREYTKKIKVAGDYLLSLINDVLDMSKIESGKTTLHLGEVHIDELVDNIEMLIRPQAETNHQEFTVTVENITHNTILGDELRIRQVIMNLLSNALKYTPASEGSKIGFTVRGVDQPKDKLQELQVIVQDNGYGIAKEFQKTMFEPFTRVNNTMTGRIQGTGLGLAITKSIVDLMGGTIRVESEPGKGSTFTVDLAFAAVENVVDTAGSKPADTEESKMSLAGLHILAAEDNELNAEILVELLNMERASCKVSENGEAVLKEFESSAPGTYDLILMDVQMPVMNGYEATRAIRASTHPEAKTIPIVAMTANAFSEDVKDSLDAGMNAHIAKPVDMAVLKKTVCRILNKPQTSPIKKED